MRLLLLLITTVLVFLVYADENELESKLEFEKVVVRHKYFSDDEEKIGAEQVFWLETNCFFKLKLKL